MKKEIKITVNENSKVTFTREGFSDFEVIGLLRFFCDATSTTIYNCNRDTVETALKADKDNP